MRREEREEEEGEEEEEDRERRKEEERLARNPGRERERGRGEKIVRESKKGPHNPFYSKPGLLGYCQVIVGQNLEEMLTEPRTVPSMGTIHVQHGAEVTDRCMR